MPYMQLPQMLTSYITITHLSKPELLISGVLLMELQTFIHILPIFPTDVLFLLQGPGHHVAFLHRTSLVSSHLWQCPSLPLFFMTLTVLRGTSQVCCRMSQGCICHTVFSWPGGGARSGRAPSSTLSGVTLFRWCRRVLSRSVFRSCSLLTLSGASHTIQPTLWGRGTELRFLEGKILVSFGLPVLKPPP